MWIKNFRGSAINSRHIISIYKETYSINKNDPIKYHVYAKVSHAQFEHDDDHNFRLETFDNEKDAQRFIDRLYFHLNNRSHLLDILP